jgi:predicted transcriptional regulator
MNKIRVFNNEIEMGLRVLVILKCIYPRSLDREMINYYDYFSLHSKDIGGEESLHADVPNRSGELSVKRGLIERSLKMLLLRGLVKHDYNQDRKNGFEYIVTKDGASLIDNLNESYTQNLISNVTWVCHHFKDKTYSDIRRFVAENEKNWNSETPYCTVGLIHE